MAIGNASLVFFVNKLYRNRQPTCMYFKNFVPEYGESSYNLRNCHIHLPDVRCEFGKLNANIKCISVLENWLYHQIHQSTL